MSISILPAVPRHRSLRVELIEALFVSSHGPLTPDALTLQRQGGALARETVPLALLAGFPVLPMGIRGTGTRHSRARLLEVTFVCGVPAGYATWF